MTEPSTLAGLALEIALLPPISRGAHLNGPRLHAERLVALWRTDEPVPLADAPRLLHTAAVAGAILRLSVEIEGGDPRYWWFLDFVELLPALRELAWQDILAGRLVIEAVRGVRENGTRRVVAPIHLQRLAPDWELSWLCRGAVDEYVDVRVQRPTVGPPALAIEPQAPAVEPRAKPTIAELRAVMGEVAEAHRGKHLTEEELGNDLTKRLGRTVTRQVVRDSYLYAPELKAPLGRPPKISRGRPPKL